MDRVELMHRRMLLAGIVAMAAFLALQPARAANNRDASDADFVVVQETHWGFDGTLTPRTYLPVSFLVQNVSPQTVTVTFELSRLVGNNKPVGTVLAQEVTLSGESSRWVQFVPYVVDEFETWTLKWGPREAHQQELPQANLGRAATVLIYLKDDVTPAGGVLKRMPDEVFPTSVTATDGLRGLIFNKVPYWQGARARAFLEWLRGGGRVYLLLGPDGEYPSFPAPLEALNQRAERFRVGTGRVKRVPRTVDDVDLQFARAEMFNDEGDAGTRAQMPGADLRKGNTGMTSIGSAVTWNRDFRIQSDLVHLARYSRNWVLIYASVAGYLLALWPGCYRIGRGVRDYRWFYAAFACAVILFSMIFISLGRLGAKVSNRTRSVATARSLGEGVYDVTQWTTIAVASGGDYTVAHQGSGTCFSNSSEFEAILGSFVLGSEARAEFTIPPGATRTFQHRRRLSSSRPTPQVVSIQTQDAKLTGLTVDTGGAFIREPEAAVAIYRGTAYELKIERGSLSLDLSTRQATQPLIQMLFEAPKFDLFGRPTFLAFDDEEDNRSDRLLFQDMFLPLAAANLGLNETLSSQAVNLDDDVLRLVVYARMPEEFLALGDEFPDQQGRVLYSFDTLVQGEN